MSQNPEIRYAGFWIRALASAIDSLLLLVTTVAFGMLILGIVYWVRRFGADDGGSGFFASLDGTLLQNVFSWAAFLISVVYYTYAHYRYATTIGKRLLGIYVVAWPLMGGYRRLTLTQSLMRELGTFASTVVLGMGYFMVAFHPERRALHELLAGTVSIRAKDAPQLEKSK